MHLSPAVGTETTEQERVCERENGGGTVTARPLTLRRQPSAILKPVGTEPAANPIHQTTGCPPGPIRSHPMAPFPTSNPAAIQRANDSLTEVGSSLPFFLLLLGGKTASGSQERSGLESG